jgi:hypothetical protein
VAARRQSPAAAWIVAAIGATMGLAGGVGWWRAQHVPLLRPAHFTIEPPAGVRIGDVSAGMSVAISRDGQTIAFIAGGPSGQLHVRRLDQLEPTFIRNVSPAADLHFSPDGDFIAFHAPNRIGGLAKIAIVGGNAEPTRIADIVDWTGLSWTYSPDVVYVRDNALWRVPPGAAPHKIAWADTAMERWSLPHILPDGRTIALRVHSRGTLGSVGDSLAVISIDGGSPTRLGLEGHNVIGYVDGTLIFSRTGGRIMGVPFDLAGRKVRGEPVLLLSDVAFKPYGGAMAALSDNGTLAYLVGSVSTQLQIVGEHGDVISAITEPRRYGTPVWSPDGKRIALSVVAGTVPDIWVYDAESRVLSRVTQNGGTEPAWAPDGKRIAFIGERGNRAQLVAADGSGTPQDIPGVAGLEGTPGKVELTRDGKYAIVATIGAAGGGAPARRHYAIPLAGGAPVALETSADGQGVTVSPNGKWMAYSSGESGRAEIYIRPFPTGSGRVQVSSSYGALPSWSADGRRLFYAGPAYRVASLDVSGELPRVLRTDSLFTTDYADKRFSVHPDGKRFAIIREAGEGAKLIVITNWMTEVRAKLAARSR